MSTNVEAWNHVTKRRSSSPKLSNRVITFGGNDGMAQTTNVAGDGNYQYDHIRKLNERLAYLQSENAKHNEILQQHIRYYTGELEKLQDELSESRKNVHEIEEKYEEKTLEVDTFRKEKHRLTVEVNDLVSSLEQRDRHIQTIGNSGVGWKSKYDQLEEEFRNYKRMYQQDKMENKRVIEECNRRLQNEMSEKNRILQQREDMELALETLKKQHSDVIDVLNDYKDQVENKNHEIHQRMQSALGERESLELQITESRRESELVRSDMGSLNQENALLKDQLKLMKEHTRTIEKTSQENVRRLRLQLESETAKIQRLQSRLESVTGGSSVMNSPPKKYVYKQPVIDPLPLPPNLRSLPKPMSHRRDISKTERPSRRPVTSLSSSSASTTQSRNLPIRKRTSVGEHFNIGGSTKQKLGYFYPTRSSKADKDLKEANKIDVSEGYKKRNYSQLQQFHVAAETERANKRQSSSSSSSQQPKKTTTTTTTTTAAPNSNFRSYKVAPKYNYENIEIQKRIADKMIHGKKKAARGRSGRKLYSMSRGLYDHNKEHLPTLFQQERDSSSPSPSDNNNNNMSDAQKEILGFEKEQEKSRYSSQQSQKYPSLLDKMKNNRDGDETDDEKEVEEGEVEEKEKDDDEENEEVVEDGFSKTYRSALEQRQRNSKWNQSSIRDLFRDDQITSENLKRNNNGVGGKNKKKRHVVFPSSEIGTSGMSFEGRRAMEINPLDPSVDRVAKKEKMLLQTSEKITLLEPKETKENVDEFISRAQQLEIDLMNLGLEGSELDGELQKIDHMHHRTARSIVRRREIEARLLEIRKEQSGLRTRLKQLGIFY